jgi:hypothetical protein
MSTIPTEKGSELTFAFGSLRFIWFAVTSDVDLLDFAEITTVVTLGHWATLLANL